jgi:hypothetical protein
MNEVCIREANGKPRSASEGRLQLDGGFLKYEAMSLFWTQKQLSNRANENHSCELLRGYPIDIVYTLACVPVHYTVVCGRTVQYSQISRPAMSSEMG